MQSFQKKKVKAELKASEEKREPSKVIVKYSSPTGRPLDARTARFNGPNLLDCTKSMRLCNQGKYRKCTCIDSKISSSCRKYWFGVNSLGWQSFQTDRIRKASKNFIKSQNPWCSKKGDRVLFHHEIVTYVKRFKIPSYFTLFHLFLTWIRRR